jgi:hypothetical protein
MASYLSENLNEREVISTDPTRLHGWSLTNTGTEASFVAFKEGEETGPMVVVPAGEEKSISGLDEPFPGGLAIERLTGDGTLIANVFYDVREVVPPLGEE